MDRSIFFGVFGVTALFIAVVTWAVPYMLFGFLPALFFLPSKARVASMAYVGIVFDLFSSHMFGAGLLLAVLLIFAARILDAYRSLNVYLFGFGIAIVSLLVLIFFMLFRLPSLFVFGGIDAALDALILQLSDIRILFAILIGSIFAVVYARHRAMRYRSAFFSL